MMAQASNVQVLQSQWEVIDVQKPPEQTIITVIANSSSR